MPSIGIIAAIGASAASAGAGIYGANKSSEANELASQTSAKASGDAITEQQKQDAQQKAQFDANLNEQQRQWDATQTFNAAQWNADQARKAPYRAAGAQALVKLGDLLGTKFDPGIIPQATQYTPVPFNGTSAPTAPAQTMTASSAAPFTANAPMAAPAQTVKLASLMPQQNAAMSPAARQVLDPATGQMKTVVNT